MTKTNPEAIGVTQMKEKPSICVLGLGYIGLPTASILASRGHQVHGVDVRQEVVDTINAGEIHIHEPHLDTLVRGVVEGGTLTASLSPCEADIYFICVPTPIAADHSPDLSYVEAAAKAIRPFVKPGCLVILESTSPPQTTENVVARHAVPEGLEIGKDVFLAHCPERVLPGRILIEAVENDRIVGGVTAQCTQRAVAFYRTFVEGEILPTSARCAEFAKLVENSYRDVNIAFANELSMMASDFDVDPFEIIELANHHPRVNILTPGPGVGGHCISVDPWFLVDAAPDSTPLIRTARNVNNSKPEHVVNQTLSLVTDPAAVIGCLGLAYKADVDDLRESPSIDVFRELTQRHPGRVVACEPFVDPAQHPDFELAEIDDVIRECDIIVLLTDHQVFRDLTAQQLAGKTVVDTRGIWRHHQTTQSNRAA
jgi:UDP-N-acetyl-D-mannosaminuronic acid dehydrogenase